MGKASAMLLALLVATNAIWLIYTLRPTRQPARDYDAELATLRRRISDLEAAHASPPAAASEATGRAATAGAQTTRDATRSETRRPSSSAAPARPSAGTIRAATDQVAAWKADVLQIEDPARREAGLAAFEDGIRSGDSALAAASLRSLYELRDAAYDKSRFREPVRSRLEDENADVRRAAMYALLQVEPEPADADRVVDILVAHPEDTSSLIVAAWLAKSRVEGTLSDLYVRALATEDAWEAENIANQLRGMWVTAEVDQAAVDAYRRRPESSSVGLWFHILGQFRPTREPRVKLLFEILETAGSDAPQLLGRALARSSLDPSAAGLAADLALSTLPKAPNALTRQLCLRVLRESGTSAHAAGLRAYAENPMVAEELRKEAAAIVALLERR